MSKIGRMHKVLHKLRGAGSVEYVVATTGLLLGVLVPFGADSLSVIERLKLAIKQDHAGYLYASSAPVLPRVALAGGGIPSGSGSGGSSDGGDGSSGSDGGSGSGGSGDGSGSGGTDGGSGGGAGGSDGGGLGSGDGDVGSGNGGGGGGSGSSGSDGGSGSDPGGSDGGGSGSGDGPGNGSGNVCAGATPSATTGEATKFSSGFVQVAGASQPTGIAATHVGNPIHVVTGNKYQQEVDLLPLPGASGLAFMRHYNSRSHHQGSLGHNWRHLYETRLAGKGDRLYLWQADGRRIDFVLEREQDAVRHYQATQFGDGTLSSGRFGYQWRWRNETTLAFDRRGQLLSMIDAQGNVTRMAYDKRHKLRAITDPQSRVLKLGYDSDGRLITMTGPAGSKTKYRYDALDNLEHVTYPDETSRRYHYDDPRDRHNLTGISTVDGKGHATRIATWAYDADDRAILSMHKDGTDKVVLAYRSKATTVTGAQGVASVYRSKVRDAIPVVTAIEGPGCGTCDVGNVSFHYDSAFHMRSVVGRNGNAALYEYDSSGRLVRMGRLVMGGRVEWLRRYGYDGDSARVTEIAMPSVNPNAERMTRIRYDADHRPIESVEKGFSPVPNGGFEVVERKQAFGRGRGALIIDGYRTDVDDRMQASWHEGLLKELRYPDGEVLRIAERDGDGRPTRVETSALSLSFSYDPMGRLDSVAAAGGSVVHREHAWTPTSETRTKPGAAAPHLRSAKLQAGIRTITDRRGNAIRQGIDDFSRTTFVEHPDAGLIRYVYDEAGNLRSKTVANGDTVRLRNDVSGRPVTVTMPDQIFDFDWIPGSVGSRLGSVSSSGSKSIYRYDSQGRLAETIQAIGRNEYRTVYRYNKLGRLSSRKLTGGHELGYRYQGSAAGGRFSAIVENGRWGSERNLVGTPADDGIADDIERWSAANGIITTQWFDSNRLRRMQIEGLHDLRYHRDARGRVVGIDDGGAVEQRYRFNRSGQLDLAITPSALVAYRYDVAGNRTRAVVNGAIVDYAYASDSNRLVEVRNAVADWRIPIKTSLRTSEFTSQKLTPVVHSAQGEINRYGALQFRYNANGQPAALFDGARQIAGYNYDSRAQRISKTVYDLQGRASETQYLYEGGQLIAEADEEGRILREYVYLQSIPAAVLIGKEIYSVHANHLGAPIAVTDARRRLVWSAVYAPFGEASIDEDPDGDGQPFALNLRLPGQYHDAESGLHYNHHRYYDPALGRYLSSDPLGANAGPNTFAYAGGDPINNIDPSGLLLFAFDGTGNADTDPTDELTNVVRFRDVYKGDESELAIDPSKGHGAHWYYITGSGTADARSGIDGGITDSAFGTTMGERVLKMAEYFIEYLNWMEQSKLVNAALNVDIVGFSRGAAEARIFANLLNAFLSGRKDFMAINGISSNDVFNFSSTASAQARLYLSASCIEVNLRFLGLWDTVPHIGIAEDNDAIESHGSSGDAYLSVPDRVQFSAHAVSVNENRDKFDALSILTNPGEDPANRIERGFLGAHADIGGGYSDGDLSDVALAWMVKQAEGKVLIDDARLKTSGFLDVRRPYVHDEVFLNPEGFPIPSSIHSLYPPGRLFRYLDSGSETDVFQKQWTSRGGREGGLNYLATIEMIEEDIYKDNSRFNDHKNVTSLAKQDGKILYQNWLKSNYDLDITIIKASK